MQQINVVIYVLQSHLLLVFKKNSSYSRYIATSETYRSISDRFGVTMSSTHRAVRRCTTAVVHIADQYICWPDEGIIGIVKNNTLL